MAHTDQMNLFLNSLAPIFDPNFNMDTFMAETTKTLVEADQAGIDRVTYASQKNQPVLLPASRQSYDDRCRARRSRFLVGLGLCSRPRSGRPKRN